MSRVRFAMTFTHTKGEHAPARMTVYRDGTISFLHDEQETVLSGDGPPVTEQEVVDMLEELVDGLDNYEITEWKGDEE
jgi:xanthine dehydrogenase molybdopterin-binding subunit B